MHSINIDEDIYSYLIDNIKDFGEQPNDVLRRLLGLAEVKAGYDVSVSAAQTNSNLSTVRQNVGRVNRRPQARLSVLVKNGYLEDRQGLYLYITDEAPGISAKILGDYLEWQERKYSMSALALKFAKQLGYKASALRGPSYWYESDDENARSITELWEDYLKQKEEAC